MFVNHRDVRILRIDPSLSRVELERIRLEIQRAATPIIGSAAVLVVADYVEVAEPEALDALLRMLGNPPKGLTLGSLIDGPVHRDLAVPLLHLQPLAFITENAEILTPGDPKKTLDARILAASLTARLVDSIEQAADWLIAAAIVESGCEA